MGCNPTVRAWLVFGSNKVEDYQSAIRVGMEGVRPLAEKLIKNLDRNSANPERAQSGEAAASSRDQSEVLTRLQTVGSLPLMEGNSAKLLVDGEATFAAILDAISEAQDYILIQFYIFRDDGIGKRIRDSLVTKAREGVAVFLLLDNLSSFSDLKELEEAGVKIYRYQKGFLHQKVMIASRKATKGSSTNRSPNVAYRRATISR